MIFFFVRFNIFFDQDTHFFYPVFSDWHSFFYLLYPAGLLAAEVPVWVSKFVISTFASTWVYFVLFPLACLEFFSSFYSSVCVFIF